MTDISIKQEDHSRNDGSGTTNGDGVGDVCRDFLRNVCRRGNSCRFRHPDPSEAEELGKKIEYIFCHDYQNRECRRQNCRFLHCTKQEEEVYRSTGKLPQHVLDKMAANKASEMAQANVPICKDHLKGECRRGPGRCKFRHISQSDYDLEMRGGSGMSHGRFDHSNRSNISSSVFNDHNFDGFAPPEPKRRAYDSGSFGSASFGFGAERAGLSVGGLASAAGLSAEFEYSGGVGNALQAAAAIAPQSMYNARFLEEENAALRRRIDELKKQVADLMATNEFLLEQNAQLRTLGKAPGSAQAAAASLAPPNLQPLSSELLAPQRPSDLGVGVPSVSLAQAITGIPVSSIASMAASLPTSVSLSTSAPLVSYPIITTQSMQTLRPATIDASMRHMH